MIRRLLSPAGFVLVGVLFLLPFLTVSCSPSADDRVVATFDGVDLLTGGDPDVSATASTVSGEEEAFAVTELKTALGIASFDRQPFAIAAAAILLLGMLTALIGERLARHASAVGLAGLAGALLVGAFLRAERAVDHALTMLAGDYTPTISPDVTPATGFWLMLGTLVVVLMGNSMALARAWPSPTPAAPTPAALTSPPESAPPE